jgi:hypothetical protein
LHTASGLSVQLVAPPVKRTQPSASSVAVPYEAAKIDYPARTYWSPKGAIDCTGPIGAGDGVGVTIGRGVGVSVGRTTAVGFGGTFVVAPGVVTTTATATRRATATPARTPTMMFKRAIMP